MTIKVDKVEAWRLIGDNVPRLEVIGPHSNQYKILVEDIDGDYICMLPAEAKRLIRRLELALGLISDKRKERMKKVVSR